LPDLAASSEEVKVLCILGIQFNTLQFWKDSNSYWWFEGTAVPYFYCHYVFFFFLFLIFDSQNTFTSIFVSHNFSYFFNHFFFIFSLTWSPYFILSSSNSSLLVSVFTAPTPIDIEYIIHCCW
jgi:hypothetical protein